MISSNPVIQRFEKTSTILNQSIGDIFREGYGIDGITYDNVEEVYNPLRTGFGSLYETHHYLLSMGMKADMSQTLCRRYLNKLASKEYH